MLVTVVIPSYNHCDYVGQAIESVLDQTWPDVELIVIDDGSTDGSVQVIEELHARRGGFQLVVRENRGLIRTLAQGLELTRGDYFCELASDDYFPPESLSKRVEYLEQHPEAVAVFANGTMVFGDRISDQDLLDEKRRELFALEDPIPAMLNGVLPVFATGLFRKDDLLAVGGFDAETFRYYEDLEAPVLLATRGRLGFVDEPIFYRREHETNVSTTTSHIRCEKARCFAKFATDSRLLDYRPLIMTRWRRALLALGRYLHQQKGGRPDERETFKAAWPFVWQDPRLLPNLLRYGH